jgi:ABC-type uncharacterized transport system permease subunit
MGSAGNLISNWEIRFERRICDSPWTKISVPLISIAIALIIGGLFLALTGHNPLKVYLLMFNGAFGSAYGLSETVVKAIPLILTGLAVAFAFRMLLWNIGAEGQLYMGAFAASWVALSFPDLPMAIMLPSMVLAGFLCGAVWGLLPAIPRALWGVNEVITTLMLNYVAILWVDFLVYGPWKDPDGFNFPYTAMFSDSAILPAFGMTRIHMGLFIALAAAVVVYVILKHTGWGYEIRVIGESETAARYAGMNIFRNTLLVMMVSGGLAGLAGMSEVSGITNRLQHAISPGFGYTAIIIAWLSRLHPLPIILISFLLGGLLVGGYTIQTAGIPAATAAMLQGAVLFCVLGGDIFNRYRVKIDRRVA